MSSASASWRRYRSALVSAASCVVMACSPAKAQRSSAELPRVTSPETEHARSASPAPSIAAVVPAPLVALVPAQLDADGDDDLEPVPARSESGPALAPGHF